MKSRFHPQAEQEVASATKHYLAVSDTLGERFNEALLDCVATIESRPRTFPRYGLRDAKREIRSLSIDGFPFSVCYEILNVEIVVLAVAHHRRRAGYWHRRKP